MKCKYCNAEVTPNTRFCTSCGADLSKLGKCARCGEFIEKGEPVCPHCGAEQPQIIQRESGSKNGVWILLSILLFCAIGGAGYYFFIKDSGNTMHGPQVDTDTIEELADGILEDYEEENMYSSPLAFLEEFYKGDLSDVEYIKQHVTANVLNKLRRDYEYDCPSGDCLATWIFTAYPPGTDLKLDKGPSITESNLKGVYRVLFCYYLPNGNKEDISYWRDLFLTLKEIDGKYLISDYELEDRGGNENEKDHNISSDDSESQAMSTDENTQRNTAWFVFGTNTELKEQGVLEDGQVLRGKFNKDYFTKIDTRIDKEIKLYSKSARILTSHPANSFTLKPDENKLYVLRITDPQQFWSTSEYLVILVE